MVSGVSSMNGRVFQQCSQMFLQISVVQVIDSSLQVLKVNENLLHKRLCILTEVCLVFFFFPRFPLTS